ncbi:hypothetical protein REPUB_Repub06bG0052200 [Reevesia pubescens]
MSVIFWNYRGAGGSDFMSHAKELIRLHKLDMFIVAEPRISGLATDKMIRKLHFDNYSKIDAQGFSSGIWILWRSSIETVQVLDKFGQGLSILINNGHGIKWVLTAIYASPTSLIRERLWSYLTELDGMDNVPWLLIVNRSARPFCFEMAWLSHESFGKLLKDN